jgi:hypothetical protein
MICYLTYIPTSYLTHLLTFYVAFLSDYILTLAFRCDKYSDALSDILSDIFSGILSGIVFAVFIWNLNTSKHSGMFIRILYILSEIFCEASFSKHRVEQADSRLVRHSFVGEILTWWGNNMKQPPSGHRGWFPIGFFFHIGPSYTTGFGPASHRDQI